MTQDLEHRVLRDAAVVVEGERIAWLGSAADAPAADDAVDAGGRAVLPGWVDSHTHLVFAGDRTAEFEARMAGESYSAGGIAVTMDATRRASDFDLTRLAMARVSEAVSQGTTYLETKTGYGLDIEHEARSARIASTAWPTKSPTWVPTWSPRAPTPTPTPISCAGPCLTPSGRTSAWADVFCEAGAFTAEQSRRVLQACRDAGLGIRVHGNQLGEGPGVQLAVELGAASVDHVNYLSGPDVAVLAASWSGWDPAAGTGARGTVATCLPACDLSTRQPLAPARAAPGRRRARCARVQLQPGNLLHQFHGVLRHHRRAADAPERPRGRPRRDVRRRAGARAGSPGTTSTANARWVRSPSGTARTCTC